jgi:multiple sugar transport system substrate-binding protein
MQRPTNYLQRLKYQFIFIITVTLCLLFSCSSPEKLERSLLGQSSSTTTTALNIWWEKGFNLEEDEALRQVVSNWEQKTGEKVSLSLYTTRELSEKAQRALQAGNPPDLMMSHQASLTMYPRLAWEGKLADVSEIIEPVKSSYTENILQAINYYNKVEDKRSYYGVPIYQATLHIFYWQQLLSLIGYTKNDIPQNWDGFWQFWQQVQKDLQIKQQKKIYGLGFPFSIGARETCLLFEQILEAYNVTLVNAQGQLLVDSPLVRQGIIKCLDWYSQFYQQGYVPPDAINWLNTDNNRNLLNRAVVMTPNSTLSISAAVRQDRDTYYNQLGILEFPHKPSGKPMRYLVNIRQAVIFANSLHQKTAKDFLQYLIQPQTMTKYLKASGSRNLPVQQPVWEDPFWQQTEDPYIVSATKIFTKSQSCLFYITQNPAYSLVFKENVWSKALIRIVVDQITPEQAADEAITRLKQIFQEWS